MINFRYHVVSLTAVFLALAIGLIVGTAALNGPVANDLQSRVSQLSKENSAYRDRVNGLNTEVTKKEQFATEVAPQLLAGKLTGRRVLIVSMPKSDGLVADLKSMLALSGAKVTGAIEINDKFVDPTENATLIDLAEKSLSTAAIDGLPANSDGVETSSALLGAVLLDNSQQITANARQQVLSAYDGYISGYKDLTGPAETVVFLAPPPYTDNNATAENKNVETIVDRFSQVPAPVVVASAGASGSGNVIGAVTGDATLNSTVSTVDNVDTPEGQVATVLAVEERLVRGKTGHYGLSSSSTSLLPKWPED